MNRFILILIVCIIGSINKGPIAQSCTNNSLTTVPEIHLEDGDVFIEGSCDGLVLTAPNSTCFRVLVNDDGSFGTESANCPFYNVVDVHLPLMLQHS